MDNFPKKKIPQPVLGAEQSYGKGWQPNSARYNWNPGSPRTFVPQHNFGDTQKVNATNPERSVHVRKKEGE